MRADLQAALQTAQKTCAAAKFLTELLNRMYDTNKQEMDDAFTNVSGLPADATQAQIDAMLDARVDEVRDFDCLMQRIEELETTLRHIKNITYTQPKGLKRLGQIQALIERVTP